MPSSCEVNSVCVRLAPSPIPLSRSSGHGAAASQPTSRTDFLLSRTFVGCDNSGRVRMAASMACRKLPTKPWPSWLPKSWQWHPPLANEGQNLLHTCKVELEKMHWKIARTMWQFQAPTSLPPSSSFPKLLGTTRPWLHRKHQETSGINGIKIGFKWLKEGPPGVKRFNVESTLKHVFSFWCFNSVDEHLQQSTITCHHILYLDMAVWLTSMLPKETAKLLQNTKHIVVMICFYHIAKSVRINSCM